MGLRTAIVGLGRLGSAFAAALPKAGWAVTGLADPDADALAEAAAIAPDARCSAFTHEITSAADLVLITAPDSAIAPACEAIARQGGFARGAVVLHASGVHSSAILAPARAVGAAVGSIHPLQSFPARRLATAFAGTAFAVEGDPVAVETAERLAAALGGRSFRIPAEAKPLYHAAAVFACNYLVALERAAEALMGRAGFPAEAFWPSLGPLVRATVEQIGERGVAAALTGPIARGDRETVALHLEALASGAPEWLDLYRRLGRIAVDVAVDGGSLSDDAAAEIRRILGDG